MKHKILWFVVAAGVLWLLSRSKAVRPEVELRRNEALNRAVHSTVDPDRTILKATGAI